MHSASAPTLPQPCRHLQEKVGNFEEEVDNFILQVETCRKKWTTFSCKSRLAEKNRQLFLASRDLQKKVATFSCKSRLAEKSGQLFLASLHLQLFFASRHLQEKVGNFEEEVDNFILQVETCRKKWTTFSCKSRLAEKSGQLYLASRDLQKKVATFSCKSTHLLHNIALHNFLQLQLTTQQIIPCWPPNQASQHNCVGGCPTKRSQ